MEFKGMTAIVTGGASGLGEASVRRLASLGANVIIIDRDADRGEMVAKELGKHARFAKADVTSEADIQSAVDLAKSDFGAVNILVNCAGVGMAMRTTSKNGAHPLEVFETVIKINLIGTFNCIRLAATAMESNTPNANGERGVIVNTASVAAFDGQ
ncbi:MAG TPA: SDR family NAD(P)-dependent oxidoreductase, partial [Aggregatilineales bacterium]|nr:SDR family NAD(P)-dependent oxidoreductase [Aggregatilineales bacterium]